MLSLAAGLRPPPIRFRVPYFNARIEIGFQILQRDIPEQPSRTAQGKPFAVACLMVHIRDMATHVIGRPARQDPGVNPPDKERIPPNIYYRI